MLRSWVGPFRLILCLLAMITLVYCLGISVFAYSFFYHKSRGTLIHRHNAVIASKLMGQQFTQNKYFWPRQSMTNYQNDLLTPEGVFEKNKPYWHLNSKNLASASQVDPDITIADAYTQIERVAKARDISVAVLERCIVAHSHDAFMGFGQPHVNVLLLNLDLDENLGTCHG